MRRTTLPLLGSLLLLGACMDRKLPTVAALPEATPLLSTTATSVTKTNDTEAALASSAAAKVTTQAMLQQALDAPLPATATRVIQLRAGQTLTAPLTYTGA
ncbi:MAG: hypothetical protein ACR2H9_07860 [Longimicrobiaceae bacterium]